MAKDKTALDIRLPISQDISLNSNSQLTLDNPKTKKLVVREAVKAAYSISDYDAEHDSILQKPKQLVSDEKIETITNMLQALQPTNSLEAALANQFVATHTQGMKLLQSGNVRIALPLLAFSQSTLDTLNRYRNKGSQQINVQYNVNNGQVVSIKNNKVTGCEQK